ncbi:Trm112p-domain-containing protein [Basidiobolus meristosporus CBS 931.73]|uniref:Trm112p-domain-containing protein n=1 Tax=Basidiobolus meristosporus CBS 931.73 TaxID=1314790 RepID=A0A1Y1X601_9FUNG|nr:Trm112p-domain-containing protein [Basidiobolus meristosporus CBS 931.73]|eukprot:ORX81105.1 Trm112p-domain-containing protein [Basidiobolus meristosporus CBS 931.73]
MRLITHNMLQCHAKGCTNDNFPLRFEEVEMEVEEVDMNPEFLVNFLPKLDWAALIKTAVQLGINDLPETLPENAADDEEFLQKLHTVLMETRVQEGRMVCNGCGHIYRIKNGIPNMLLAEHEI